MPMEGIELTLVFFDSQVVMHDTWRLILAVIGSLCKNVRRCLHYVQKNENKTGPPYGCLVNLTCRFPSLEHRIEERPVAELAYPAFLRA